MLHLLYRLGRRLTLKLSPEGGYRIAEAVADVYYIFARTDRRNLTHNLKIALKTDDERAIKKHTRKVFRNFANYLVDFCRLSEVDKNYIEDRIEIAGTENLNAALAKGKGVILVSAHIGNWELGAAIIASLGYPLSALVLDHKDKRVNDFFVKQRSISKVKAISLAGGLKNCFKVLRENEFLAIAGDKDFTGSGVKIDFFGREAILPKGAALFSLKTGAPVIPAFLIRKKGDTFELTFEKPVEGKITGNKDLDTKNVMRGYFSVIEKYVRKFPDQWYAYEKIWE